MMFIDHFEYSASVLMASDHPRVCVVKDGSAGSHTLQFSHHQVQIIST